MNIMNIKPGQRVAQDIFSISAEQAKSYTSAVGSPTPTTPETTIVPPMSVVAKGLSYVIKALSLGAGTVHTGQEVKFNRPVIVDEKIRFETVLTSNRVRGTARFATLDTKFLSEDGYTIAQSISMVIVPV